MLHTAKNDGDLEAVEKMVEKMKVTEGAEKAETPEKEEREDDSTELTETKYFVEINRTNIMFGKSTLFPGSIEEFDVSIGLKDEII